MYLSSSKRLSYVEINYTQLLSAHAERAQGDSFRLGIQFVDIYFQTGKVYAIALRLMIQNK